MNEAFRYPFPFNRMRKAMSDPSSAPPSPLSQMTLTSEEPNGGITFRQSAQSQALIPKGSNVAPTGFPSGIYKDGDTTRYVKGAIMKPEGPFKGMPSAPMRIEHAVHNLYHFFSNEQNGIGKVSAALHTGPDGHVVQPGHQWHPEHFAWMSTEKLPQGSIELTHIDPRTAHLSGRTPDPKLFTQALHTMKRGAVVDALLDPWDTYGMNFMTTSPDGKKLYRIDTGAHVSLPSPLRDYDYDGYRNEVLNKIKYGFWIKRNDNLAILPDLAMFYHVISDGFDKNTPDSEDWRMSGLHDEKTSPKERDAYWDHAGHSAIEQARAVLEKYRSDPLGFAAATQHVPGADAFRARIHNRLGVLQNMIDVYGNNPSLLGRNMRKYAETKDLRHLQMPMNSAPSE